MRLSCASSALLALAATASVAARQAKREYATHHYYVLEHNPRSQASHQEIARELGAELVEQVGELQDHWLIRMPKDPAAVHDPVVDTFESLRRRAGSTSGSQHSKRDILHARRIASGVRSLTPQVVRRRAKRWIPPEDSHLDWREENQAEDNKLQHVQDALDLHDPEFPKQWHLLNTQNPPHDMNVSAVWEMGYTGKGVISAVVDDGLEFTNPDLAANYWAQGSWDFNDNDPDPLPVLSDDLHGTRCCGEIAAVRNDVCGVGVAYESKIAGVRILSGAISDADEAASLNYGYNETALYSCSWGPPDDGQSMEAPSPLIQKAVLNGVEKGRGGKGSIFVFASGNGAMSGDHCNFDGYTNSIYSVTVSAVDSKGKHPHYSETCAANMIVAYSSGSGSGIHTTDVGNRKCTNGHGGTSAAAPLAVGVIALALEARPDLTWRDVQHLCVHTARQINPEDPDWEPTQQGRPYSYKYGFGVLDAWRFVTAAQTWNLVKPQAWIEMPQIEFSNASMTWEGEMSGGDFIPPEGLNRTLEVTQEMMSENNFEKLEHVTVKVWINHSRRGDVEVYLVSPNGVQSVLGSRRRRDEAKTGYPGWTFMTLKHWDENPVGTWTIHVNDQGSETHNGTFLGWTMSFWGSAVDASKAILYSQRPRPEEDLPDPIFDEEPSSSVSRSEALSTSDTPTTTSEATTANPEVAVPTTLTPSTTYSYVKPTEHLPEDHDSAEGETHQPAFPDVGTGNDSAEPSSTPTPDEGYFSHMSDLLSNNTWFYGGIALMALFAIGAGVYMWRRRARPRTGGDYTTVADDDMAMTSMLHGGKSKAAARRHGGTKELYDAFGEVSDEDDEYVDEEMGLRGSAAGARHSPTVGLQYHDGFLDDEAESPTVRYRDDPTSERGPVEQVSGPPRDRSPGSSGSGSWEHAHASNEALNRP